jgi:hypothetical protein
MGISEVHLSGSEWGKLLSSCEKGHGLSGSIKCG